MASPIVMILCCLLYCVQRFKICGGFVIPTYSTEPFSPSDKRTATDDNLQPETYLLAVYVITGVSCITVFFLIYACLIFFCCQKLKMEDIGRPEVPQPVSNPPPLVLYQIQNPQHEISNLPAITEDLNPATPATDSKSTQVHDTQCEALTSSSNQTVHSKQIISEQCIKVDECVQVNIPSSEYGQSFKSLHQQDSLVRVDKKHPGRGVCKSSTGMVHSKPSLHQASLLNSFSNQDITQSVNSHPNVQRPREKSSMKVDFDKNKKYYLQRHSCQTVKVKPNEEFSDKGKYTYSSRSLSSKDVSINKRDLIHLKQFSTQRSYSCITILRNSDTTSVLGASFGSSSLCRDIDQKLDNNSEQSVSSPILSSSAGESSSTETGPSDPSQDEVLPINSSSQSLDESDEVPSDKSDKSTQVELLSVENSSSHGVEKNNEYCNTNKPTKSPSTKSLQ